MTRFFACARNPLFAYPTIECMIMLLALFNKQCRKIHLYISIIKETIIFFVFIFGYLNIVRKITQIYTLFLIYFFVNMFFYNITNNRYVLKFDARIHFTKDRQVRTR